MVCAHGTLRAQDSTTLSRDDLFEKAFGAPAPELPKRLHALLIIDGDTQPGEIALQFSDGREHFSVPLQAIESVLQSRIDTAALASIQKAATNGYVSDSTLTSAGVNAEFNSGTFSVILRTNPRIRRKQDVFIAKRKMKTTSDVSPARFSGYLNLYLQQAFKSYAVSGGVADTVLPENFVESYLSSLNDQRVQPFTTSADFALRVLPVVFEGKVSLHAQRPRPVARQDFRLVYDSKELASRFSLGDNTYRVEGYQEFLKGAGLAVDRRFSIRPWEVAYPVSEEELYLEDPAEVQVVVNGVNVRTLSLDAGTHNLKNFATGFGENEVELIIKDFHGRTETKRFSFFHNIHLLGKEKSDFSCFLGVPSKRVDWTYEYDPSRPLVSGFAKYGLDNRTNLGVNGQYYNSNALLGLEAVYASRFGLSSVDLGASLFAHQDPGIAMKLSHRVYRRTYDETRRGFSVLGTMELRSSRFSSITDTIAREKTRLRLAGAFEQPMSSSLNATLGFEYENRRTSASLFAATAALSIRPAPGLNCQGRVRYQRDPAGNEYPSISIRGVWNMMADRHTLTAGEHLQMDRNSMANAVDQKSWLNYTDIVWNYRSSYALSDYFFSSAGVTFNPFTNSINANTGYTSGYGRAQLRYSNTSPASTTSMPFNQHQGRLDVSTALIFADNHVAISRPVMNSFVMVTGKKGDRIPVNPGIDGNQATARGIFPGVVPEISAYSQRNFRVESTNISALSETNKVWYKVFTGYKTGHVIALKAEQNSLVYATLHLPGGTPAARRSITIKNVADTSETSIPTFTSSTGKLSFPAIAGETYRIALGSGNGQGRSVKVTVPLNTEEYWQAGTLVLGK